MRQRPVAGQDAQAPGVQEGQPLTGGLVDHPGQADRIAGAAPAFAGQRQAGGERPVDVGKLHRLGVALGPAGANKQPQVVMQLLLQGGADPGAGGIAARRGNVRGLAGQIGLLLHQFAEHPPQRLLDRRIVLPLVLTLLFERAELFRRRRRLVARPADILAPAKLRGERLGARLGVVEQLAFAFDHVAKHTHLLLATLALLGALAFAVGFLAALRFAVAHGLQHLVEFCQFVARFGALVAAGGIAQLFGELLHIARIQPVRVGIEHIGVRITAGLFGQRLQMLPKRILQVARQLFDFGALHALTALLGRQRVLQRLLGTGEFVPGPISRALLQMQRQRPQPRLRLVHRRGRPLGQQRGDGPQIEITASVVAPGLLHPGELIEFADRRGTVIRLQAQHFAHRDQRARDRMLERPFR